MIDIPNYRRVHKQPVDVWESERGGYDEEMNHW